MDLLKPVKYPGLEQEEQALIEGGKSTYKDMITKKVRDSVKAEKVSMLNNILYQAKTTGNKLLEQKHKQASADTLIIEYGRDRLLEKGLKDEPDELILNGFKKKYGDETYKRILEGGEGEFQNVVNTVVKPIEPKGEYKGDSIIETAKALAPLSIIPAGLGVKKLIQSIPTENKFTDITQYIKNNLTNGQFKPEYVDKQVGSFVDYFSNLDKSKIKEISKNKLGSVRGLYNQIKADMVDTVNTRNTILEANKNIKLGTNILSKLDDAIKEGGIVGELGRTQDLMEVQQEISNLIKKNGGYISLQDAEKLKEMAYMNVNFAKLDRAGATLKDVRQGEAYKLLAKGIKEEMEKVVPIKPRNEAYGRLKDMGVSVGKSSAKLEKMMRFTTMRKLSRDFSAFISAIPRVSALSNVDVGLPTAKIDEKNLKKIILQAKKRGPKIKDFMVKYGKATGATIAKEAGPVIKGTAKNILKAGPSLAAGLASDMVMGNIEIPQPDGTTKKLKDIPSGLELFFKFLQEVQNAPQSPIQQAEFQKQLLEGPARPGVGSVQNLY